MEHYQAVVLALIQGLSEFLPVSSSGHLLLPSQLLGWADQGLAFDVAVHLGSLIAVVLYFRDDLTRLGIAWTGSVFRGRHCVESTLAWQLILATAPAALVGGLFAELIEAHLRSVSVVASATIFFGVLLGFADRGSSESARQQPFSWRHSFLIGIAQALALIPGTSRSGVTITMALALGYSREAAARFSFLLAIPIIVLSGGYKGTQILQGGTIDWISMGIGVSVSGLSAYACIYYFLRFVQRVGMMPFVIYRVLLGVLLLTIGWA